MDVNDIERSIDLTTLLVIVAIVMVLNVILVINAYLYFFPYGNRCGQVSTSRTSVSSIGISSNFLQTDRSDKLVDAYRSRPISLPITTFQEDDYSSLETNSTLNGLLSIDTAKNTCGLCLLEYEINDKICTLPCCFHKFHAKCLEPWLMTRFRTCPSCRTEVVVDGMLNEECDEEKEQIIF